MLINRLFPRLIARIAKALWIVHSRITVAMLRRTTKPPKTTFRMAEDEYGAFHSLLNGRFVKYVAYDDNEDSISLFNKIEFTGYITQGEATLQIHR